MTTDVSMPFATVDSPERHEGMLVRFPQSLAISEYFNFDRFGEIVLGALRREPSFTGTAIDEPGAPALARTSANGLRRITLDDASGTQNPFSLRHPERQCVVAGQPLPRRRHGPRHRRVLGSLQPVPVQPTAPAAYTAVNARPAAPGPVGGPSASPR